MVSIDGSFTAPSDKNCKYIFREIPENHKFTEFWDPSSAKKSSFAKKYRFQNLKILNISSHIRQNMYI
jgi:hypothetical protein